MVEPVEKLTTDNIALLGHSTEPRDLKRLAVACAASTNPQVHAALARYLASSHFLDRLDDEQAYQNAYSELRLARVIRVFADNRLSSVDQALLSLIDARDFQLRVQRMQLLIRALAAIRPAPKPAVSYWNTVSQPGSPIAYDVIEALIKNQSDPAIALFKSKYSDPNHDHFEKLAWLRELLLPVRYDEPLLKCCARLLVAGLPETLRVAIIEALFDYRPQDWYVECGPVEPPPLTTASAASKRLVRRIGEFALGKVPITDRVATLVRSVLKQLDENPDEKHSG